MCRFAELDYVVEDIYCYLEFHAPCGAIIWQLPKIRDTYEDIQNLKIQNNAYWRDMPKYDWSKKPRSDNGKLRYLHKAN